MIGLRKELLVTLSLMEGIGPKSIFEIANRANGIESPEDLYPYLRLLPRKEGKETSIDDIQRSYDEAIYLIERSASEGIGLLGYYDNEFPSVLRYCVEESGKLSPPPFLYYRGNLDIMKLPGVAIIGTREPTDNGVKAGRFFSEHFAKRGFNIISGLAIGCDTTAHEGALLGGGATTAFLANGLSWELIAPKRNRGLAERIVESGGLLLSEYSIDETKVYPHRFVQRDRLQAGLALGTIVIQTGIEGGTMHAVKATLAAKKPLYAVEYSRREDLMHEKVQGNLMLLNNQSSNKINSKNIDAVADDLKKVSIERYEQQTLF